MFIAFKNPDCVFVLCIIVNGYLSVEAQPVLKVVCALSGKKLYIAVYCVHVGGGGPFLMMILFMLLAIQSVT